MKRTLHLFVILSGLLLGTLLISAARTSWSIHVGNDRLKSAAFPEFPEPGRGQRFLILSPHPDDESLACAGLIRRARSRGIPVTVAIVTNGDAFPWAVQRAYGKIRPQASDYIRFGKLRQEEAIEALGKLGVPEKDVIFLGYPDRGLEPMWMKHWSRSDPHRSRFTRRTHSPYPFSYRPHAPYAGEALTEDLSRIFRDVRPTDVFFTHPNDDHPDHAYLSCFAVAALQKLRRDPSPVDAVLPQLAGQTAPGGEIRLHTFLIHRGNWPTPQGYHTGDPLPPPAALARLHTRWQTFPLTGEEIEGKTRAIRAYRTQLRVRPGTRFLMSFVRRNELFGDYPFLHEGRPAGESRPPAPWVLTLDPTDDKVARDLQPAADLQEVGLKRAGDRLLVRVKARGKVSRWVSYRIQLHRMDTGDSTAPASLRFTAPKEGGRTEHGITCNREAGVLEAEIPLSALGRPSEVMVGVETVVGGVVVDRSAWRNLTLNPVSGRMPNDGQTGRHPF